MKISDDKFAAALKAITGSPAGPVTKLAVLDWYIENDLISLPFLTSNLEIHDERLSVLGSIVQCKPRAPIMTLMLQLPDSYWLFSEQTFPHRDSLFICTFADSDATAILHATMNKLHQEFYVHTYKGNGLNLVGINIKSYVNQ